MRVGLSLCLVGLLVTLAIQLGEAQSATPWPVATQTAFADQFPYVPNPGLCNASGRTIDDIVEEARVYYDALGTTPMPTWIPPIAGTAVVDIPAQEDVQTRTAQGDVNPEIAAFAEHFVACLNSPNSFDSYALYSTEHLVFRFREPSLEAFRHRLEFLASAPSGLDLSVGMVFAFQLRHILSAEINADGTADLFYVTNIVRWNEGGDPAVYSPEIVVRLSISPSTGPAGWVVESEVGVCEFVEVRIC